MDEENVSRTRYYGLRVGDLVSYDIPGTAKTGETYEVISYGFMDNNRVILRDDKGEEIEAVAEWCQIITKVEDRHGKE